MKVVAFSVIGAVAGLAYYKFVGCRTGGCAITGNPYVATAYSALLGLLLGKG